MAKELIVKDYLGIKNSATKIGKDVDGNMTFTDAVTGTKKLSELLGTEDKTIANLTLNESILAGTVVQMLETGKIESIKEVVTPTTVPYIYQTEYESYDTTKNIVVYRIKFDPNNSSRFVMVYRKSVASVYCVYVVAGTISEEIVTTGTPVLIGSPVDSTYAVRKADVAFDAQVSGRFIVTYTDSTALSLKASVCSVTGTTISAATAVTIVSTVATATSVSVSNDIAAAGKFICSYYTSPYNYIVTIQLDGSNNVTTGTPAQVSGLGTTYSDVSYLPGSSTAALLATGGTSTGTLVIASISGTTITYNTVYTYYTSATARPAFSFDPNDSTKFIIVWTPTASVYSKFARIGTISGTAVSFGTTKTLDTTGTLGSLDFCTVAYSTTSAGVVFVQYFLASSNITTVLTVTVSGTTISSVSGSNSSIGSALTNYAETYSSMAAIPGTGKFLVATGRHVFKTYIYTLTSNIPKYGGAVDYGAATITLSFDPFNQNRFLVAYGTTTYIAVSLCTLTNNKIVVLSNNATFYNNGATVTSVRVEYDPITQGRFVAACGYSTGVDLAIGTITNDVVGSSSAYGVIRTTNSYSVRSMKFDAYVPNIVYVGCTYSTYAYLMKVTLTGTTAVASAVLDSSSNNGFSLPIFPKSMSADAVMVVAPYRDTSLNITSFSTSTWATVVDRTLTGYCKDTGFDIDKDKKYFIIVYSDGTTPFYTKAIVGEILRDAFTLYPAITLKSVASLVEIVVAFDSDVANRFSLYYGVSASGDSDVPRTLEVFDIISPTEIVSVSTAKLNNAAKTFMCASPIKSGEVAVMHQTSKMEIGHITTDTTNLDESSIVGVLTSSGVANDVRPVQLLGGVYSGYSGLSPGYDYYVYADGTTGVVPLNGVLIGKAISTTSIKLKGA